MIRRTETRRERLTVTKSGDGALSVVNGLGVYIAQLYVADDKGSIYQGSDIAPGASATLSPTGGRAPEDATALRTTFAGDWMDAVRQSNATILRPRTYLARIDTCPFLEEGLKGVTRKRSEALVYGIMKGPGDED
jgi:hypothetical protein